MSLAILVALILNSTSVFAFDDSQFEPYQLPTSNYVDEFINIINQIQLQKDTSYLVSSTLVSDGCVSFIDRNSVTGPTGIAIAKLLIQHSELFPHLLQGGTMNRYCRNYSTLTQQRKSLVWVMLLTTMAHFESSCNSNAKAKGPNGTAYGYFQLHRGEEQNYAAVTGYCVKNASQDPRLSSQCTLGMLEYQLKKTGGDLFNKGSYWEVLRPRGASQKAAIIQKAFLKSTLCSPVSL